jgi:hypothetical protein
VPNSSYAKLKHGAVFGRRTIKLRFSKGHDEKRLRKKIAYKEAMERRLEFTNKGEKKDLV